MGCGVAAACVLAIWFAGLWGWATWQAHCAIDAPRAMSGVQFALPLSTCGQTVEVEDEGSDTVEKC
jgi:hypothetical protein